MRTLRNSTEENKFGQFATKVKQYLLMDQWCIAATRILYTIHLGWNRAKHLMQLETFQCITIRPLISQLTYTQDSKYKMIGRKYFYNTLNSHLRLRLT